MRQQQNGKPNLGKWKDWREAVDADLEAWSAGTAALNAHAAPRSRTGSKSR
jgi:hypothetical protein